MNNIMHRPEARGTPNKKINKEISSASGNWLVTDTKGQIGKDGSNYNQKNMRQNEM